MAHVGNGEVIFQLYKETPGLWKKLELEIIGNFFISIAIEMI